MKDCDCQEHQSIFCMLNLSETASEAELIHAYDEQMALLDKMQPISEAEQKLLEAKRQELICAMEKAKGETLSQRVQTQYQKRKAHEVRLYSCFPVGFLGLILRLINAILGTNGLIDKCFHAFFRWIDLGCCACSLLHNDCIFDGLYSCCFSNNHCLCGCPSCFANCYEQASAVRYIDMGVSAAAVVGSVIYCISGYIEYAKENAQKKKLLTIASAHLHRMIRLLDQRDEMVSRFINQHQRLKAFPLDIRPFTSLMAKLPGATEGFVEMARRFEQPGSFFDRIQEEFRGMEKLHSEIVEIDRKINELAKIILQNENYCELDEKEHCSEQMNLAANGLQRNYKFKEAESFISRYRYNVGMWGTL